MRRKKSECDGFQDDERTGWQLSTSPLPPLAWQEKVVASARLAKGVGEKNEKEQEGAKVVCRVRVDRTAPSQVLLRQLPLQAQQAVDPYAKAARLAAKRVQEVATHLGSAYVATMRRAGPGGRRRRLVPETRRRAWLPVEAAVFLRCWRCSVAPWPVARS